MKTLPNLTINLGKLKLKNSVLVASGTFGYGEEYAELINLDKLGGIITKAVTLKPKKGNPPPRLAETPSGLLNAIGLQNPGVEVFIREKMPFLRKFNTKIIVNIAGDKEGDYLRLAERLSRTEEIDALEVNISCPNVKKGESLTLNKISPNRGFNYGSCRGEYSKKSKPGRSKDLRYIW